MKKLLLTPIHRLVMAIICSFGIFVPMCIGMIYATTNNDILSRIIGCLIAVSGYALILFWLIYRRSNGIKE